MKIALIFGSKEYHGFYPMGIMYLASYCRKYVEGVEIDLYDIFPDISDLVNKKYDLIGLSCVSFQFPDVDEYGKKLRGEYSGIIVLGGVHISLTKKMPLWADICVIGEGEVTFSELVRAYIKNGKLDRNSLSKINGLLIRDESGNVINTGPRAVIKDLDTIPYPARDLLNMENYLKPNNVIGTKIGRGLSIVTSRGCAYNCDYCAASVMWGGPRFHSAQYVLEEVKYLVDKYKLEYIWITDDNFCSNKKRLIELAEGIEKSGLNVGFGANGRIEFYDDEMADIYRRIGIKSLAFGIETGSDRILKQIKSKSKLTVAEEVERLNKVINDGIEVQGLFMLNMPGETLEDLEKTIKIIHEVPFAKCSVSIAVPFYGTKWWDIALEQGIVPADPPSDFWRSYDMKTFDPDRPIFRTEIPREKLIEIFNELNKYLKEKWFFDWRKDRKI